MGQVLPSQRLLKQFEERLLFGDMNPETSVGSADACFNTPLEREVTEALGRGYYENAPETTNQEKGLRNRAESHRVLTGEGAASDGPECRRWRASTGLRGLLDAYAELTEKLRGELSGQ